MMTAMSCPVSFQMVDHNTSRTTCLLTIAGLTTFAATGSVALIGAIAADYTVRAWTGGTSPMQAAAGRIARVVGVPVKLSDKAPKQFAARIGWMFAVTALVLMAASPAAAAAVAMVLAAFNALDGVGDFCVGCWTYTCIVLPLAERVPAVHRLV